MLSFVFHLVRNWAGSWVFFYSSYVKIEGENLGRCPWARDGAVLSQHLLLLLYQILHGSVNIWGSPRAWQPRPWAAPVQGGLCTLISTDQQPLSLISLLSLEVT